MRNACKTLIVVGFIVFLYGCGSAAAQDKGLSNTGTSAVSRLPVVDWGGRYYYNYVKGFGRLRGRDKDKRMTLRLDIDVDGDGSTEDDDVSYYDFSLEHPLSPAAPLWHEHLRSGKWYGGVVYRMANDRINPNDRPRSQIWDPFVTKEGHRFAQNWCDIHCEGQNNSPHPDAGLQFYTIMCWKKEDFLHGADQHQVSFRGDDCLRIHIPRSIYAVDDCRWVILQKGQWYISEATFGGRLGWFEQDPTATRWTKYNPKGPDDIIFPVPLPATYLADGLVTRPPEELPSQEELDRFAAQFSDMSFTDVDAVGFYCAKNAPRPAEIHLSIIEFEAFATVQRAPRASETLTMRSVNDDGFLSTPIDFATWRSVFRWATYNLYTFKETGDLGDALLRDGEHRVSEPVTGITWYDAVLWCNALSEMEGKTPCYYSDADRSRVFRYGKDDEHRAHKGGLGADNTVYLLPTADGYRLPTPDDLIKAPSKDWPGIWIWTDGKAKQAGLVFGGGDSLAWPMPHPADAWWSGHPGVSLRVMRGPLPAADKDTRSSMLASRQIRPLPDAWVLSKSTQPPKAPPMIAVPGGQFTDVFFKKRDTIEISPFTMSRCEIDYRTWQALRSWATAKRGYDFERCGDPGSAHLWPHPHTTDEPVTFITWYDAVLWCNALSEAEGRTPCYYVDQKHTKVFRDYVDTRPKFKDWRAGRHHSTDLNLSSRTEPRISCRWSADGYRLPTLAEWLYACRGGATTQWPWGNDLADIGEYAWFSGNADGRTHPVGSRSPNALGLCDMLGNVSEWSWDDVRGSGNLPKQNPRTRTIEKSRFRPARVGGSYCLFPPFFHNAPSVSAKSLWDMVNGCWEATGSYDCGFRIVRCEAGTHVENDELFAKTFPTVMKFDPATERSDAVHVGGDAQRTGRIAARGITGEPKLSWSVPGSGVATTDPLIIDNRLLLAGTDGHIRMLALADGATLWDRDIGLPMPQAPVVHDGLAIVAADGALLALDIKDGSEHWRHKGREQATPIIAHDLLFVGGGPMWILKPGDGSLVHEYSDSTVRANARCAFADGYLYIGGSQSVVPLDLRNGALGVGERVITTSCPTVINHHALVIDWGGIGLHAPAADCKSRLPRRWFHEFPSKNAYNWPGGCAADDKTVFIGNDDGTLLAIATDKGTLRWQQQTDGMHRGTPLLTADTVYTGTISGWCYAMDRNNGHIRWKVKAPAGIQQRLGIGDGVVVAVDNQGGVTVWQDGAPDGPARDPR